MGDFELGDMRDFVLDALWFLVRAGVVYICLLLPLILDNYIFISLQGLPDIVSVLLTVLLTILEISVIAYLAKEFLIKDKPYTLSYASPLLYILGALVRFIYMLYIIYPTLYLIVYLIINYVFRLNLFLELSVEMRLPLETAKVERIWRQPPYRSLIYKPLWILHMKFGSFLYSIMYRFTYSILVIMLNIWIMLYMKLLYIPFISTNTFQYIVDNEFGASISLLTGFLSLSVGLWIMYFEFLRNPDIFYLKNVLYKEFSKHSHAHGFKHGRLMIVGFGSVGEGVVSRVLKYSRGISNDLRYTPRLLIIPSIEYEISDILPAYHEIYIIDKDNGYIHHRVSHDVYPNGAGYTEVMYNPGFNILLPSIATSLEDSSLEYMVNMNSFDIVAVMFRVREPGLARILNRYLSYESSGHRTNRFAPLFIIRGSESVAFPENLWISNLSDPNKFSKIVVWYAEPYNAIRLSRRIVLPLLRNIFEGKNVCLHIIGTKSIIELTLWYLYHSLRKFSSFINGYMRYIYVYLIDQAKISEELRTVYGRDLSISIIECQIPSITTLDEIILTTQSMDSLGNEMSRNDGLCVPASSNNRPARIIVAVPSRDRDAVTFPIVLRNVIRNLDRRNDMILIAYRDVKRSLAPQMFPYDISQYQDNLYVIDLHEDANNNLSALLASIIDEGKIYVKCLHDYPGSLFITLLEIINRELGRKQNNKMNVNTEPPPINHSYKYIYDIAYITLTKCSRFSGTLPVSFVDRYYLHMVLYPARITDVNNLPNYLGNKIENSKKSPYAEIRFNRQRRSIESRGKPCDAYNPYCKLSRYYPGNPPGNKSVIPESNEKKPYEYTKNAIELYMCFEGTRPFLELLALLANFNIEDNNLNEILREADKLVLYNLSLKNCIGTKTASSAEVIYRLENDNSKVIPGRINAIMVNFIGDQTHGNNGTNPLNELKERLDKLVKKYAPSSFQMVPLNVSQTSGYSHYNCKLIGHREGFSCDWPYECTIAYNLSLLLALKLNHRMRDSNEC